MSINSVNISGNLGRDPELRSTAGGRQVLSFSMCVNDRRRKPNTQNDWEDVPNWVDVTFFGNRAESLSRYLHKGMLVFVSGKLHQNTWEAKDGQKRSKLEVIGSDLQFGSSGQQQGYQQAPQQYQGYQQQYQPQYQQPQYAPQQYQQPQYAPQQYQQPQYAPQQYQQPQYAPQQYQQPQYAPQQAAIQYQEEPQADVYDEDIPF